MTIQQYYDKGLAHASYLVISEGEAAVIDPARDPHTYLREAADAGAAIVAVFETHPHADFVSSHLELSKLTGAHIYVSELLGAQYPHRTFDNGDTVRIGKITLKALNTPGHSPDSISILLIDEMGNEDSVFTGDTLFVGDVGRPDLRESEGNIVAKKEELAAQMYDSTRRVLMLLNPDTEVWPAHGPGSLCGKSMGPELSSTIGKELKGNYALQPLSKEAFVDVLLEDQPFVPKYFGYNVRVNRQGAPDFNASIAAVPRMPHGFVPPADALVIDSRPQAAFKAKHLPGSINLQDGGKFETWLGSVIGPEEKFYLISSDAETQEKLILKAAKIGYESNIAGALMYPLNAVSESSNAFDKAAFDAEPGAYTILDVRNHGEVKTRRIFTGAISIPLPELRERLAEIPTDKPIIVHCAAGYRSAAAQSIIEAGMPGLKVSDLGDAISTY
ncbi:MAG: MBL fold metallo-hydrolase [Bacteroidota bacterium]